MLKTKQELALEAIRIANEVGVPAAIVCAIIEVSSHWNAATEEWNPTRWLLGQHPVDLGGDRTWLDMGTRWGLMQVLGQEAFEVGCDMDSMRTIDGSLRAGCKLLKKVLNQHKNKDRTLLVWFGHERKHLASRALAILPDYEKFVEAAPCVNGG